MTNRNFRSILAELDARAQSAAEKGKLFEKLVKAFLEQDQAQSQRFAKVWLWSDWPDNGSKPDTGIDIVAEERDTGNLVAIQCKFYGEGNSIDLAQINKFLSAYDTEPFSAGIIVATTHKWTTNAEAAVTTPRSKPVSRWGPDIFEKSSIDWENFDLDNPAGIIRKPSRKLRDYQQEALNDIGKGFADHERGKLIMACGSGKTLIALRYAEQVAGKGGTVLFLTPSISLLSQSLLDWSNDADLPLKTFAVCSDAKAGRRSGDDDDISPYDLRDAPSTNPDHLVAQYKAANTDGHMTVIFSTYQSLDVIANAQQQGLPNFDLIVCDEAHRTTGAEKAADQSESNFRRVHDNNFVTAAKRLYMTATPRIYGDQAKRKANEKRLTLASMDDETVYGPEFHRLGFGKAVELDILSPHKIIIFNVDQEQVGTDLHQLLSDPSTDINMDIAARMIGCWNGLNKRDASGLDFTRDPLPARRAVAFSNTIKQSKAFHDLFPQVIRATINSDGEAAESNRMLCEVKHVDGTQNALQRSDALAWLRAEPEPDTCRILSNARCLTEGIDVPALDAILFLHPRKSDIDVVQAVGRVMRRSPGKQFGYIILPVAQSPSATPQEALNGSAYQAVWQVINAISAHDDRFEAQINQLALTHESDQQKPTAAPISGQETNQRENDTPEPEQNQLALDLIIAGSPELRDAILAKIVEKYADPGYWEQWAGSVHDIAQRHEARLRALLNIPDSAVRPVFDDFLAGIRNNLNDGVTEADAIGMLSQHLICKPVFDALFADYDFIASNPVSRAMQSTLETLQGLGLEKETEGLESFYRDVRICVQGVTDPAGKQKIIAELYQRFFKLALPETASRLGIVYTPIAVVDYIIRGVEDILNQEFDTSISDPSVHVMDPFTGTGSFITRLLQSGLLRKQDLLRKYEQELHANEITLLAYYVAAVNIESAWHGIAQTGEYHPFKGIVLTDTFQAYESGSSAQGELFPQNDARIARQKDMDIRVIIGNPPWSATNSRAYPNIDRKIQQRYAAPSATRHLSALYDPYVRAIRLASDRIQSSEQGGIIAFVTNGGFIDSNAFDGFRKTLAQEFHAIYCLNLRGDQRTSGEKSRQEAGKIFGSGSRAGVAILILVKKPGQSPGATIHYHDIGDYRSREEKLNTLNNSSLANTEWQTITPNEHGDWIGQRNAAFATLRPLVADNDADDGLAPIFQRQTLGLVTSRDAWCYSSSQAKLQANIQRSVDFYNERVKAFQETKPTGKATDLQAKAKAFVGNTPENFHWDAKNYRHLANGRKYKVDNAGFRIGAYRPFFKQRLYFAQEMNNSIRDFPNLYPTPDAEIRGINLTREGASVQLHALMTDTISDYHLTGDTIHLPQSHYTTGGGGKRSKSGNLPHRPRIDNPVLHPDDQRHHRQRHDQRQRSQPLPPPLEVPDQPEQRGYL